VFHVSIWGAWSFVWGAKPTKAAPRGDGTGQTVDKSWIAYQFFPTSFYEWVQLMLLLQLSEGIKIPLQRTYNAVNHKLN